MRVGDQQTVVMIEVATDFRALCHEPGSAGDIMRELCISHFIIFNHFLGSCLWSLYQILADPPAVLVGLG